MPEPLIVYKNRTNRVTCDLGIDVSGDTLTSEIRSESGELIASWVIVFDSDGTDGKLILTIDNAIAANITAETGLMDMKRMSGGEPLQAFADLIEVQFQKVVTV